MSMSQPRNDVQAAFLRSLPSVGFVPPERGTAAPSAEALVIRAAVADFARRFWSLAPSERRAEWLALSARTRDDARCVFRMARLEPNLDLDVASAENEPEPVRAIESALRELAVLAPPDQAVRRAEFIRGLCAPLGEWQKAALAVRAQRPAIAALDPALIDALAKLGAGQRWPTRTFPKSFQQMAAPDFSGPVEPRTNSTSSATRARPTPKRGSSISVIIAIVVVINIIRLLVQSTGRNDPYSRPIQPLPQIRRQSLERSEDLEKRRIWLEELEKSRFGPPPKLELPPSPPVDSPTAKPPS